MTLGEKIRNAREDLDLTQQYMAEHIPINQSNYSKIERDVQEPSIAQLRQICILLNLDPRYLLDVDCDGSLPKKDIAFLTELKKIIREYQI